MENLKIEKKEKSTVEITGEIPYTELNSNRSKAVKKLGENLQVDGFRKGKIPEKIILEKVGEGLILQEMADLAMREMYPKIILEKEINPIAAPQITITKLAPDNPLGFKIEVAIMPEVELPEYKKIAGEVKMEEVKITNEEIQKVIDQVIDSKKENGKKPELTDELAKNLGDFKDVNDLKKKIKEGLEQEKKFQAKNKVRTEIIEKILEKSVIDLPEVAIQSELQKMLHQFRADVERMKMKWQDYLEKIKKTEEDLLKEWRTDAEKRASSQIILNKIAVKESLIAEKEEVDKEVEHILSHHKEADSGRARIFAEQMLTNENVLRFLEGKKRIEESLKKE